MFFDTPGSRVSRRSNWHARLKKNPKDTKAKLNLDKVVLYEDVDVWFVIGTISNFIIMGTAYFAIVEHLSYRKNWKPVPFSIFSFPSLKDSIDYSLMGCLMLMMVDRLLVLNHSFSWFFKAPLYKAMRDPFFSKSVGDFWSNQWNGFTQGTLNLTTETLRRGIFDPIMMMFPKDGPFAHPSIILVSLLTFAVSGVMHEVGIAMIFNSHPDNCELLHCGMEMTSFFVFNGIWVILERIVFLIIYRATGWQFEKQCPRIIASVYTLLVLVWLSPLFCNPLISLGVHERIKLW